jgi:outer membrane protein assembly factor BamB
MKTQHRIVPALGALMAMCTSGCFLFVKPNVDWFNAGSQAYHQNRLPEAQEDFNKVAASDPRYQRAQFYLGAILAKQDQLDPALDQLQRARNLNHETFDIDQEMVHGLAGVYTHKVKHWVLKEDEAITGLWPTREVLLTIGHHGTLTGINPDSQTVVWEKPVGVRGGGNAASPQFDDASVFVTGADKGTFKSKIWALDLKSGRERWSAELGFKNDASSVATDREYVYAGAAARSSGPATLNAYRKSDGRVAFSMSVDGLLGPIAAAGDVVCAQDLKNKLYCGHRSKQLRDAWTYDASGKVSANGLAVDHGHLYASINGDLYAFNIGAEPPLAWKVAVTPGNISAPAVANGRVYVQTVDSLRAFDAATGKAVWAATNPGKLISFGGALPGRAPAIDHDLVVGWTDELIFAVPAAGGDFAWMVFPAKGKTSNAGISSGDVVVAGAQSIVAVSPRPWASVPVSNLAPSTKAASAAND